ncbi:DUF5691 domain-containing protein [Methylorubrum salsuginis]|uniref:Uncharacterized protein n=1 Tax=Methylorubrum salsuginis TaxID=414703 RepID=A0A1I4IBZ0_9HYPH|nr:DUF5691 domain-containing protein [Methylorubrum salsuginis]SFL51805.1 hypothetical protein SAMN04488125_1176 [Methylorubrum salsuginis]
MTEPSAGRGWDAALAAALIGAERAPPPSGNGALADLDPGGEAGPRLLARLAAHGLHHLAGTGRAAGALTPLPPRMAHGPECPPAAATRLALLLAAGPSRSRLAEWCDLAAASGVRAPVWLLPALAPHRPDIASVETIAGAELDWLAQACGGTAGTAPAPEDWQEGTPQERRAAFVAFRARDPDGARAALEAGFKAEKAQMRETLVYALETGLGLADADFLETCLDDRAAGVRSAAQRLLPHLPGSLFASRMAVRAKTALSVESKPRRSGEPALTLAVTLPEESPTLARDGVTPNAYEQRGGGARAGMLREILAAAPLSAFAEHPPAVWIELALRCDFSEPVFEGLFRTIARERDPDWLRDTAAVLAQAYAGRIEGVRRTKPLRDLWARAVTLLPPADWDATVREAIRAGGNDVVLAFLGTGPAALSEGVSAAVLDWLAQVSRGSPSDRHQLAKSWLLDRLGERLEPSEDAAAAAAAILARLPEDAGERRLGEQFPRLVETLELRAAMRREFSSIVLDIGSKTML